MNRVSGRGEIHLKIHSFVLYHTKCLFCPRAAAAEPFCLLKLLQQESWQSIEGFEREAVTLFGETCVVY